MRRVQRAPLALLLPASAGLLFLVLPLAGLLIRAPWGTMPQRLTEPGVLTALRLSLQTATLATVLCVMLGVPLAWLLARVEFPESARAVNDYPIIVLKGAPNKAGAQAFVEYVKSDKGRAVLSGAGFQVP